MRDQLIPRAEIERKVAQLMEANLEATDEQLNEVAELCVGALLDIRDLLAEIAMVVGTTGEVTTPVDRTKVRSVLQRQGCECCCPNQTVIHPTSQLALLSSKFKRTLLGILDR